MFKHSKEITGKKPSIMISDGAPNFHTRALKNVGQRWIQEQNTFSTLEFKVTITITKCRDSTVKSETEKRQWED